MKYTSFLALLIVLCCDTIKAQVIINRDREIEQMVQEISTDSLSSYINTLVAFGTRNTLSSQTDPKRGIDAARKWVLNKFNDFAKQSDGRLTAIIDTTTLYPDNKRINKPVLLGNVVATLKGTDPDDKRIFIITAHLDNMRSNVMDASLDAPGANDDGSGVAAVLECARIMSKHRFPASILFVTVSGEEQGLLGAHFMASAARKDKLQIEAVLNNDIMGSNNSNETHIINNTRVRIFSEGLPAFELEKNAKMIRRMGWENDSRSRQLARYVKETGERYVDNMEVVLIYRNDRFLRGGDHSAFVENGFPAVRITEMNENYTRQHQDVRMENGIQYGDLPQFIDYEYLRKNTAVNLSSLANMAKAPPAPENFNIEIKKLGNKSSLSWEKPKTGIASGYYLLIRETTSPVWQKKFFTDQTEIVLPFSKDNYFFGIQSVNAFGNESIPILPETSKN